MSLTIWALITSSGRLFLVPHFPLTTLSALLQSGPLCCIPQMRAEAPLYVWLLYCRVFEVEGTLETIWPGWGPGRDKQGTTESAFESPCLLVPILSSPAPPQASHRSSCPLAGGVWEREECRTPGATLTVQLRTDLPSAFRLCKSSRASCHLDLF